MSGRNSCRKQRCYATIVLILTLAIAILLSSCGRRIEENVITGSTSSVVYGASQFADGYPSTYQVCESGIVYLSGHLARYYDFAANQKYILCTRTNCMHRDEKCPAFAADDQALTGLAYFQDAIYMVRRNSKAAKYELLRFDPASSSQKVIAAWDIGSYEEGEWVIQKVDNVSYSGNYAWMEVTYNYVFINESGRAEVSGERTVLTGTDLMTGDVFSLNEVTDGYEEMKYCAVSPDYVVFEKRWYKEPMLMKWEFQKELQQEKYMEFADADDPYFAYTSYYTNTVPMLYTVEIYHIPTGSVTEFASGECPKYFGEDGSLSGVGPGYVFDCITGDMLLYSVFSWEEKEEHVQYGYSFQDGTTKELFRVPAGGTLTGGLVGDGLVLCCEYTEDDQAQIFYYHIDTGQRTDLFLDERRITFRMIGCTEDSYIGMVYDESLLDQVTGTVYRISKEDYEAGNLDAAKKLPV